MLHLLWQTSDEGYDWVMDLRGGGARKLSILQQQKKSQSESAIKKNVLEVITSEFVRTLESTSEPNGKVPQVDKT
jgi:hypothetical protein